MTFLHGATLSSLDDKKVLLVVQDNGKALDTTTCRTFLENGLLLIDCIPKCPGKYIAPVPDDAVISPAMTTDAPTDFAVIVSPDSLVAKFIQSIVNVRNSWN